MDNLLIAERYAQALLETTEFESALVDDIAQKLNMLSEIWNSEGQMRNFLLHPEINNAQKKDMLSDIAKELKLPQLLLNTLFVLIDRDRIALIKDLSVIFEEKANNTLKKATAVIKSAAPLSQSDKDALHKKLCTIFDKKEIEIEATTDENLIGGIMINVDRSRIDATIKNTLNEMKNKITK